MKHRFLISGGGTGGHIFPAIAIADELKSRIPDAEILFVGAKGRMEMEKVPRAGYKIRGIWISGLQRKLTAKNLMLPFKLIGSFLTCFSIIKKHKPNVVIGTGGYASGPLLYVAGRKKIKTVIQEQNSFPGMTNRKLASAAKKIFVAYPNMERYFDPKKLVLTGNPIRKDIATKNIEAMAARRGFDLEEKPTLLILGGSLGAKRVNELISEILPKLLESGINIIWQCGKLYEKQYLEKHGAQLGKNLFIAPFLFNMTEAFAAADLVISRAGANTLSELAVVKKPAILIPSPNVAEDHQTKNAVSLTEREAALLFKENQSAEKLFELIASRIKDKSSLQQLSENIGKLALPNATENIVDEILNLISDAK